MEFWEKPVPFWAAVRWVVSDHDLEAVRDQADGDACFLVSGPDRDPDRDPEKAGRQAAVCAARLEAGHAGTAEVAEPDAGAVPAWRMAARLALKVGWHAGATDLLAGEAELVGRMAVAEAVPDSVGLPADPGPAAFAGQASASGRWRLLRLVSEQALRRKELCDA